MKRLRAPNIVAMPIECGVGPVKDRDVLCCISR